MDISFAQKPIFWLEISKDMIDRRPMYFKQPAWSVAGIGLACLACDRLRNYDLCLSQAGRPHGLFGSLIQGKVLDTWYQLVSFLLFSREQKTKCHWQLMSIKWTVFDSQRWLVTENTFSTANEIQKDYKGANIDKEKRNLDDSGSHMILSEVKRESSMLKE